jgi:hypothetical protein
VGTPILAVSTEGAVVDENLQVYLYTRQIIPFEPAIVGLRHDDGRVEYEYDESRFRSQMHLLLDGVRDEVEKRRYFTKQKNVASSRNLDRDADNSGGDPALSSRGTMLQTLGEARFSQATEPDELASSSSPSDLQDGQFVFVSHGDKHAGFVQRLTWQLSEAGVACYSDRSIAGQDFYSRIQVAQETILRCSCLVVLISRQTMSSELVRDQLAFAEDKGRPIIPVVLNDLDPGLDKRYTLVRSELFHFMANGMSFKTSFDRLVSTLRERCDANQEEGSYGSITGSEAEHTRNLDSIEGLEDNRLDWSSTRIRM